MSATIIDGDGSSFIATMGEVSKSTAVRLGSTALGSAASLNVVGDGECDGIIVSTESDSTTIDFGRYGVL